MPANNSYIVMSTVSKQFLKELSSTLEGLNIANMDIQGINTSQPIHMTIGQAVGKITDSATNIVDRNQQLVRNMRSMDQVNCSIFMLPADIIITPQGVVLLTFEPIDGIQNSSDIKQLNQTVLKNFEKVGLYPDKRFSFLPHITIGKLNPHNANTIKSLEDRKTEILDNLTKVRPLNIYDLKLNYNVNTTQTEELYSQSLPRRDYSVTSVINEKTSNNEVVYYVNMQQIDKALEFVEFLFTMGIYQKDTIGKIFPKQVMQKTDGNYTIMLTAAEKAKINGIVTGISESNDHVTSQTPSASKSVTSSSNFVALGSNSNKLPTSKIAASSSNHGLKDFLISGVIKSTTGLNPNSFIVTLPNQTQASKFVTFLGQNGIYRQNTLNTLKNMITQPDGSVTVMLHPNEKASLQGKVKGI